jgi:DNA-binding NtrC family response regulator
MTHAIAAHRVDQAPELPRAQPRMALRVLATGSNNADGVADALDALRRWAREQGAVFEVAQDLARAARRLSEGAWDLAFAILTDRPEDELAWWIDSLRGLERPPRLVPVVDRPSMAFAMEAERLGVAEVLSLPLRRDDLTALLERQDDGTGEPAVPLPFVPAPSAGHAVLIGQHRSMLAVYQLVARVANSSATVLIQGESGTGKEVVARTLHAHGPRALGPFVAVNCAAIPENLLESELFGHEKGAFTGAIARRAGRFEQAIGGTLFLDEVADMSLTLQAKILRAVQEREIERVGGSGVIPVDVRLVAATNRDLREAIDGGTFREDLYYRLAIVTVRLPRLAERGEDLLVLTAHFVREFGMRYGKRVVAISGRAVQAMRNHHWEGNVRELRNVIEHAMIVAKGEVLRMEDFPEQIRQVDPAAPQLSLPGRPAGALATLAESEVRLIARALTQTGGALTAAAKLLGIHRNTLTRKMKTYGL